MNPSTCVFEEFCEARHSLRSSSVFTVPLWDLPRRTAEWIPVAQSAPSETSLSPRSCLSPSYPVFVPETTAALASDTEDTDVEIDCASYCDESADSDACSCIEDGMRADHDAWSLATLEGTPVCCRRMGNYTCAVSAAILSPEVDRNDIADMSNCIAAALRGRKPQWAVLAVRSGYFAGAVFDGPAMRVHKTFSRYTIRRKQGRAQSSNDCSGGKAQSAGSNLRRYGEQRLREDIHDLVAIQWAKELAACEIIFVSASKQMRSTLIGAQDKPYVPHSKVRRLSLIQGRPTLAEVRKAYLRISSVTFVMLPVDEEATPIPDDLVDTSQVSSLGLHEAAESGDADLIVALLEEGADPTSRDVLGRVPFDCATRAARRAFLAFRQLRPDAWDWEAAFGDVPGPKQPENERRRRQKKKEGSQQDSDPSDVHSPVPLCREGVRVAGHARGRAPASTGMVYRGAVTGKQARKPRDITLHASSQAARRSVVAPSRRALARS